MLQLLAPPIFEDHGSYQVRLADDARKIVAYLGFHQTEGFHPVGTGFFIEYGQNPITIYLVTAAHVAKVLGNDHFVIRLNDENGQAKEHDLNKVKWTYHKNINVDLAVLEFTPPKWADYMPFPEKGIADEFKLLSKNIGAGDLTYIVGVYRLLHGENRNIPIVHTGHIALMPGDELIPTKNWNAPDPDKAPLININGYLIEASTLPAISGAPVLARRTIIVNELEMQGRELAVINDPSLKSITSQAGSPIATRINKPLRLVSGSLWLLGVWHGAWMGNPSDLLKELMLADYSEYNAQVPLNMGVAVPTTQLIEILKEDENLIKSRVERRNKRDRSRIVTPQSNTPNDESSDMSGDDILKNLLNMQPETQGEMKKKKD